MNKPMYCPMSQMNITIIDGVMGRPIPQKECTPDCAWAIIRDNKLMCSIPYFMAINPDKINSAIIEVDE